MDILKLVFGTYYFILKNEDSHERRIIFSWLIVVYWVLTLKFFRASKSMRVFVNLVITSFTSVRWFLLVVGVFIMGLSNAFYNI